MKCRPEGYKRISSYGYVEIKVGNDFIFEHRHVIEKSGVRIGKNQVIHHINGIKTDNRLENLVVITRSDHAKHHYSEDKNKQNQWKSIQHLGAKSLIKKQNPRPKPTSEGMIWNNHNKRKGFIVRKCKECSLLFWSRKEYKWLGFCVKCSCRNAQRMRYK